MVLGSPQSQQLMTEGRLVLGRWIREALSQDEARKPETKAENYGKT